MSTDKKIIIISTGEDSELSFAISITDYNQYVNSVKIGNMIQPAHNFLIRVANDDATKAAVKAYYASGYTADLLSAVIEGYKPEVDFRVKSSASVPMPSTITV